MLVIARGIFPDTGRIDAAYGSRLQLRYADLSTPASIADATAGAAAVVVATQVLDGPRLAALPASVRVISRSGVGLDAIDLDGCARLGIAVLNQPAYGAVEVASHAVAMLLTLQRRLVASDTFVRNGWSGPLQLSPTPPLDELTLGLVGGGRIGLETARLMTPLVRRVLVFDPFVDELPAGVQRAASLAELLRASELVSLHLPLTPQTRGLIGAAELELLPEGAIVVNVARGGILDEDAMARMLHSGRLGGAAFDVFAQEPIAPDAPILAAPNTLFSPHVAAYSERSSWRLASWALDDALAWLTRREVEHGAVAVAGTR